MGASFWVHARGQWRRLETGSGRVGGWVGRARFCFVRRGRLQLAPPAAVLRGLRALQDNQPTSVREGIPLSQRRRRVASRAVSPRCCCGRAAADARNALVQLSLTALQPAATPLKTDAAVQANGLTQTQQTGRKRTRSPEELPPAKVSKPHKERKQQSDTSESSVQPCKELIVNEEDVIALRRLLQRDRTLFDVDLRRFDTDDAYKSALFYRINPLVCVARDPRIPDMLRQQRIERRSLRAFASSLGLRAVSEIRARGPYRMRPRPHSSDKENRRTAVDASPNKSANKSRSPRKLVGRRDFSTSSDSDSDFRSSYRGSNKKMAFERSTRAKLEKIRAKYEIDSKKERDADVRSKYLIKSRNKQVKNTKRDENNESNDDRSQLNDNRSKDRDILSIVKDKERNDKREAAVNQKLRNRLRNSTASKNISKEISHSEDRNRRRSQRLTDNSPSIITRKAKTTQREESTKDDTETTDSSNLQDRTGRSRDRRRALHGNNPRTDESKDNPKHTSPSKSDIKDKKRNDDTKERELSIDRSKDRRLNGDSSKGSPTKDVKTSKDNKAALSNSQSPSKSNNKTTIKGKVRKINNIEDSDGSEKNVWANRNGTKDIRDENSQSKEESEGAGGESRKRKRRSTANTGSVFPPQRREYSSLEDHAIVQWVSLGSRARRVNGNAVWRELQEQFARIAGRERSWHSLRNRYLRGILPALGQLALPPQRVAALRAAQAKGEIKSRRRAPVPNPLLTLPAVRSAWAARPGARSGARPGARGARSDDDTQDTIVPATSESEPTQRTLRSSMTHGSPQPSSSKPLSPKKPSSKTRQPSPSYSEVTRRFVEGHASSTPELLSRDTARHQTAPSDMSPHKKTRKLFNPKMAM